MKKIFILGGMAFLIACNSNNTKDAAPTTANITSVTENLVYPYPVNFTNFKADDQKNTETVLNIWKYWDSGNVDEQKKYWADTIEGHAWDGFYVKAALDSFVISGKQYRSNFSSIVSSVNGVISFSGINKATGKDENWAAVWGKRLLTDTKGKTDSMWLHEAWRFNKEGKADALYQFAAKISPLGQ